MYDSRPILLVEDEANQRLLYQMELEDEGYHVVLASDGREALLMAREAHPDLLVLDLKMPGMDTIEILERMRIMSPQLPVIIHSAYEGSKSNFLTWVVDAYVTKSSDPDALKEAINQVLSERKQEMRASQI